MFKIYYAAGAIYYPDDHSRAVGRIHKSSRSHLCRADVCVCVLRADRLALNVSYLRIKIAGVIGNRCRKSWCICTVYVPDLRGDALCVVRIEIYRRFSPPEWLGFWCRSQIFFSFGQFVVWDRLCFVVCAKTRVSCQLVKWCMEKLIWSFVIFRIVFWSFICFYITVVYLDLLCSIIWKINVINVKNNFSIPRSMICLS